MKISEVENYLARYRSALGDIEVYRGLQEYGHTTIDEIDLKNMIRLESEKTMNHSMCNAIVHRCRETIKEFLVIKT